MTLTILPLYFSPFFIIYFGVVLIIGTIALVKTIKLYKSKNIRVIDFLIGLIISLALYGFLYSLFEGEKEGLAKLMFGSLIMVFIPFILYAITHNSKKENFISKVFLISIAFTFTGIILIAIISLVVLKL